MIYTPLLLAYLAYFDLCLTVASVSQAYDKIDGSV